MASSPAWRFIVSRALRGLIDGAVSVLLAGYLVGIGFGTAAVGTLVTATMLGSAALTIGVGQVAHRFSRRRLLVGAALLMAATGIAFATCTSFWALLIVGVIGTLNPSSGDVSVFLPLEQAALAETATTDHDRAHAFARYNVAGTFAGALGALAAALPATLAHHLGVTAVRAERSVFVAYAAVGVLVAGLYQRMPGPAPDDSSPPSAATSERAGKPAVRARPAVLRLAALFSLDSFGGGFVVQSLLALWLYRRFALSISAAATIFFVFSLAGALSQFLSPRLARRIGLIPTMVYTHAPANIFLIAAAFMPSLALAVLFLSLRACLSSMDVPARQAYVMAIVPPEERAAAASLTNVPRSLAAAVSPLLTGLMLERTSFGWPLVCAGTLKLTYDLLLLRQFRAYDPG